MLDSVEVPSKQAQMSDSGWKSAIRYGAVASISRFLIALVLIMGLQGTIAPGPFAPTGNNFFSNFQRWDSNWLNLIAAHGYTTTQRTVFFPGFPLTIRAVSALSAHNLTDTMAGVLISWLALELVPSYFINLSTKFSIVMRPK